MSELIGLAEAPRALLQYTGGNSVSYSILHRKVVNGDLPASRSASGRWLIDRDDLPQIARTLGLNTKEIA